MENEIKGGQASVEISTNAKGEKSWKVKAYAEDIEEAIQKAIEADRDVAVKVRG